MLSLDVLICSHLPVEYKTAGQNSPAETTRLTYLPDAAKGVYKVRVGALLCCAKHSIIKKPFCQDLFAKKTAVMQKTAGGISAGGRFSSVI